MIQLFKQGLTPKKSLGQNWLINPHILDKIVSSAEINSNDIVIEIGPGTGNLTERLVKKAGTVIAIEKDRRLIGQLKERFKDNPSIKTIEGDILKFQPATYNLQPAAYKVIGNIPYYITSNLIRTVFESWPRPELIILTIQKEVAQRIMAHSTSSGQAKPLHTNLLALSVQYYAEPEIVGYISKNNFRPVPKVDSAIIRLVPKSVIRNPQFFNLVKIGFSEKRKQLAPILSKKIKVGKEKILAAFEKEGIAPNARPENLSLEQWQRLSQDIGTDGV